MMKYVEAHMVHCKPSNRPSNLINHINEHDGIRRSEQACYIIEKYNPQDAKDMASILVGNKQPTTAGNEMHDYYPMFWEDKKLVEFCHNESQTQHNGHFAKGKRYEWYMKSCVGHVDNVDIHADVWNLSPTIKIQYPSVTTWREKTAGSHIFINEDSPVEGWHDFKRDSMFYQEKIEKMIKNIK